MVALLGTTISAATVLASGPALLVGIVGAVASAIPLSYGIARLLGLPSRMALLVACGNSICGNSAIAAVAPVIGADAEDVATSIAFTAVLGVVVVLGLPFLGMALGMRGIAYGAFAGLTVYAVPQVIAAASPLGALAVQTGTLVKFVRVLMLGPVCLILSLIVPTREAPGTTRTKRPDLLHLVPWFIIGFLALIVLRALGFVPTSAIGPANRIATLLTVLSMTALGLGVDIRVVAIAGGRVTAAVLLSLVTLGAISFAVVVTLHLPWSAGGL